MMDWGVEPTYFYWCSFCAAFEMSVQKTRKNKLAHRKCNLLFGLYSLRYTHKKKQKDPEQKKMCHTDLILSLIHWNGIQCVSICVMHDGMVGRKHTKHDNNKNLVRFVTIHKTEKHHSLHSTSLAFHRLCHRYVLRVHISHFFLFDDGWSDFVCVLDRFCMRIGNQQQQRAKEKKKKKKQCLNLRWLQENACVCAPDVTNVTQSKWKIAKAESTRSRIRDRHSYKRQTYSTRPTIHAYYCIACSHVPLKHDNENNILQ